MDLRNLNAQKLAQNDFLFETPEEAELFVEVIREEFETRVGAAISEGADAERLLEFDLCQTPEEETAWLECNCPGYRDIVEQVSKNMGEELRHYKNQIPGLISNRQESHSSTLQIPIEELDLGVRTYNCLKRAGIHTVKDIIAYGDISRIRNLSRSCVNEIHEKMDIIMWT